MTRQKDPIRVVLAMPEAYTQKRFYDPEIHPLEVPPSACGEHLRMMELINSFFVRLLSHLESEEGRDILVLNPHYKEAEKRHFTVVCGFDDVYDDSGQITSKINRIPANAHDAIVEHLRVRPDDTAGIFLYLPSTPESEGLQLIAYEEPKESSGDTQTDSDSLTIQTDMVVEVPHIETIEGLPVITTSLSEEETEEANQQLANELSQAYQTQQQD